MNYYESGGAKTAAGARVLAGYLERYGSLGSVLDVGCGDGTMLAHLAPNASRVTGIDASAEAIALTSARVPGTDVRLADVESVIPFANDSFDTLIFCDVIEHLRSPISALEELRRVMRPGGRMLVTTPNANSPIRWLKGRRWFALADSGHVQFFTSFTLRHLLEKAGLRPVCTAIEPFTHTPLDGLLRALRVGGTLVAVAEA